MSAAASFWRMQTSPKPRRERSTAMTTASVTISSAHIARKKKRASASGPAPPSVASGMFRPMPPPVRSVEVFAISRSTSATARLATAK